MSLLCLTKQYIAVAIGNTLNLFCRNTAKLLFKYECNGIDIIKFQETQPIKPKQNKKSNKNKNKNKNKNNNEPLKQEPKQDSKQESKQTETSQTQSQSKNKNKNKNSQKIPQCILITHIVYSSKHDCFIIATDDKHLRILIHKNKLEQLENTNTISTDELYSLHRYKKLNKKISSLCFNPLITATDEQYLLSSDKFGVICIHYLPSLKIKYDSAGHLSIITHLAFDSKAKYLMSCDKDFKIRISRFPNVYIIDGFCYGHIQAVTKCVIIDYNKHNDIEMKQNDINDCNQYILSGSVDGTMRFWAIPSGKQLNTIQFKQQGSDECKSEGDIKVIDINCNLDGIDNGYNNIIKKQSLIVTDIKYFEKTNIVAVSFNKSTMIYLFGLDFNNEMKPDMILLGSFDLLMDCNIYNGLYDMIFDDNGNIMCLICCKDHNNNNIYLSLDVFIVTKKGTNILVENSKNNIILDMVQKEIKEMSIKMGKCEMVQFFMGLERDWEISDQMQKNYKIKDEISKMEIDNSNVGNDKVTEPATKKQKLNTEV